MMKSPSSEQKPNVEMGKSNLSGADALFVETQNPSSPSGRFVIHKLKLGSCAPNLTSGNCAYLAFLVAMSASTPSACVSIWRHSSQPEALALRKLSRLV